MRFHPLIAHWFESSVGTPTDVQVQAWPVIQSGQDALVAAPTGSGKTFAAFLSSIDQLFKQALARELDDRTQVLYVSPLKALSNDIQKNLQQPLAEIGQAALENGLLMPELRVLVRTGDTPMADRQQMLKRPPHILVTTPESLFILLTAEKSRRLLQTVRTVIVDEIHALAPNKRGAHLALSLERLESLTFVKPQRIGLSATQRPIKTVAQFLVGDRPVPTIVDIGHKRQMDVAVEVPKDELSAVATNAIWSDIYDRVAALVREHRTTLVFVNTRRLAERVSHHLEERLRDLGADVVAAHHGSLSRHIRLSAEERLKSGKTRVVVATASLELGIDVGTVDLVCQIGSPRAIATGLQRIGRAGHWIKAIPKGRLFATTRDELLECAALIRAMKNGALDRITVPPGAPGYTGPADCGCCSDADMDGRGAFYTRPSRLSLSRPGTMRRSTVLFTCSRKASPRIEGRGLAFFTTTESITVSKDGAGRGWRRSPPAGPSPIRRTMPSWRSLKARSSARSMKTLPWRVWPATSCCSAIRPGGSRVWRWARCGWRTPMVPRRIFHSGAGKRRHGRPNSPRKWRDFVRISITCCALPIRSALRIQHFIGSNRNAASTSVAPNRRSSTLLGGKSVLGIVPTQEPSLLSGSSMKAAGCSWCFMRRLAGASIRPGGSRLRKRFCVTFDFELQAAATDNGLVISLGEKHSFPLESVFSYLHSGTFARS